MGGSRSRSKIPEDIASDPCFPRLSCSARVRTSCGHNVLTGVGHNFISLSIRGTGLSTENGYQAAQSMMRQPRPPPSAPSRNAAECRRSLNRVRRVTLPQLHRHGDYRRRERRELLARLQVAEEVDISIVSFHPLHNMHRRGGRMGEMIHFRSPPQPIGYRTPSGTQPFPSPCFALSAGGGRLSSSGLEDRAAGWALHGTPPLMRHHAHEPGLLPFRGLPFARRRRWAGAWPRGRNLFLSLARKGNPPSLSYSH